MASVIDEHSNLKLHLAIKVLRCFGEARLPVMGSSMLPSLYPGDILEIHQARAEDLSVGDIVVFARKNRLIVHRVFRLDRERDGVVLTTRGDRTAKADAPVSAAELLGRVRMIERGGRNIIPRPTVSAQIASGILRNSELCTRVFLRLIMARRATCRKVVRPLSFTPETARIS